MCNKLQKNAPHPHRVWALALVSSAAACAGNQADDLAKALAAAQAQQANTLSAQTTDSSSNTGTSGTSGGSSGSTGTATGGGLAGEANSILGGGLAGLANTFFPNLPLPANIGDLIKRLGDPNIVQAIQKAISSNQCSSELQAFESLAQPLLTNPANLFGTAGGGTAANLQPVNDALNSLLQCISKAVPELGAGLASLAGSIAQRSVVGTAAITTSATAPTELPVPSSILEVVEQLNAAPVMEALQRSRQSNLCRSEFSALESITSPLLSRAPTVLEGLQSRPSEEIRPVTTAINTFLQCMAN